MLDDNVSDYLSHLSPEARSLLFLPAMQGTVYDDHFEHHSRRCIITLPQWPGHNHITSFNAENYEALDDEVVQWAVSVAYQISQYDASHQDKRRYLRSLVSAANQMSSIHNQSLRNCRPPTSSDVPKPIVFNLQDDGETEADLISAPGKTIISINSPYGQHKAVLIPWENMLELLGQESVENDIGYGELSR